jgi:uncharacterized GH25 family protein
MMGDLTLPSEDALYRFGLLALLVLAAPVSAHEYWLTTNTWRCAAGDSVVVRAMVGTGFRGELKPYTPKRVVRFTFEGTRALDLTSVGVNGEPVWARVTPSDALGGVVCYESNGTYIELPPADFDRYLKLEGLSGPLAARARPGASAPPGREVYRRSCKTWIRGTDAARITRAYGLPLELVPDADPAASASKVGFRVLYEGKPLADALVRAWLRPASAAESDSLGPSASARTDASGRVTLSLKGDGRWLVSTVHMVPSPDPKLADWQSTWASLTFRR